MSVIEFIFIVGMILLWSCERVPEVDKEETRQLPVAEETSTLPVFDLAPPAEEMDFDSSLFSYSEGFIKLDWKVLSHVQFEEKYFEEIGDYLLYPHFSPLVRTLDGRSVVISGYHIPLEETGTTQLVVLSANPYSSCFFCGNAGPESVMEIRLKTPVKRMKMDEIVRFRGTLRLNDSDIDALNYILENAEKTD